MSFNGNKNKFIPTRIIPPGEVKMQVPCGRCVGCRIDHSREWAVRCVHESSLYENNSFITLTYAPEHLPKDGSLNKKHFQDFMKRLRKKYEPKKIRFYHCGEYGEQLSRPHYHACLFNHDFEDKLFFKNNNGNKLYISEDLTELWPFGYSLIGEVTFESAAYVARYIMKKITGDRAKEHYETFNQETGETFNIQPEYTTMSRRPGLAKDWYDKFKSDVFPHDRVVLQGKEIKPPRYYRKQYEITDPDEHERLKKKRMLEAEKRAGDNTPKRLAVKEKVTKARLSQLKRPIEGI